MHPSNLPIATAILCALGIESSACPTDSPSHSSHHGGHPSSYNTTTSALTQQPYYPPNADCVEYMIPISTSWDQITFNFTHWEDDYALEQFIAGATTRPGAGYPTVISGMQAVNSSFEIAASFCTPKQPKGDGKEKQVILATHGIGPAREHWNSAYKPDEHNFVQFAVEQGYSVFFYDRVGCGLSSKTLSGYDAQLNTAVAVLHELALLVADGQYTGSIGKPDKLALQGFSFGSYITHTAIATYPELADAVVLTAVGLNTTVGVNGGGLLRSFVPRIASLQDPQRFGALDSGYLTWVDKYAQVLNYFNYPNYDIPAVDYCEDIKISFSIGEFLTFPNAPDAGNFTGSALAITAETDYIVCDGYCPGIFEEPARTFYRNAKNFVPYLHPKASHNFNFHHNATQAYQVITDFLEENL